MAEAQGQQGGQAKPNPDVSEFENYIGMGVVGLVASVAVITLIQYAALIARYVFSPFVTPVWLAGKAAGTIGSLSVIIAYAIICAVIAGFCKLVLNKNYWFWVSAAGLWILIAVLEIAMTSQYSLLTSNMDIYCNPSNINMFAIFSCQNGVNELQQSNTVSLIVFGIVPNLVLTWLTFFTLVMGMIRTKTEHPQSLMKKVHNVDSLIKELKHQYPHLLFYDKINPNTLPNTAGQLRMMDSSRKFIFENDLVANFTIRPELGNSSHFGKQFGKKPVAPDLEEYSFRTDDLVPVIDSIAFENLMIKQLGEPWAGVENLSAVAVIIIAIALPRACCLDENMDTETADAIEQGCFDRINEVWRWAAMDIGRPQNLGYTIDDFDKLEEYRDIIYDWIDHDIARTFISEHSYVSTLLYRVLEEAKRLGVMQPSGFRWLKYHDRAIWSIVQNVNRPSGFAENIAAVSHYKEERSAGTRVNKPEFQGAYNGLVSRVREFRYDKHIVEAWHLWKTEGDPSLLVKAGWVSLDNTDVFGVYSQEEYTEMREA